VLPKRSKGKEATSIESKNKKEKHLGAAAYLESRVGRGKWGEGCIPNVPSLDVERQRCLLKKYVKKEEAGFKIIHPKRGRGKRRENLENWMIIIKTGQEGTSGKRK